MQSHPREENFEAETFEFRVREEQEMCDRAVQNLRDGSSIVIDWNTRSNFRIKNTPLPKLRTEPISLSVDRCSKQNKNHAIEFRRRELAKLLYEKNKKFYMKSKTEQDEEADLFGVNHK
jgi:hypothetical protein